MVRRKSAAGSDEIVHPNDNDVVFNMQKDLLNDQSGYKSTSRRKSAAGSDEIIHPDGKTSAQLTPERRKIRRSSSGSSEIYHLRKTPSVSSGTFTAVTFDISKIFNSQDDWFIAFLCFSFR